MFNRNSSIAAGLLAVGALFAAGSAQAGNVQWSIGVNLPPIGTVVSNVPVYAPAPVYAPVYQPRHVYGPPPVVVYQPAPRVVYRPVPVYAPGYHARYHEPRWERGPRHGHWKHDRHDRDDRHGDHRGHGHHR